MPAPRFSNFKKRSERDAAATPVGADRAGVHGDLDAALHPKSERAADISVEKPAVMIRTSKYVGATEGTSPAEAMGVKCHALYEFLMASARLELAERTSFMVPFSAAKAFLQVPRTDRIREYLQDLGNTWVSYDFTDKDGVQRIGRRMQLLQCSEAVLPSGERYINYSMHDDVRKVILAAKSYTWLELAAFAKFTCKYASRLYPILALRAGMSFEKPFPITVAPEELAAQLGWTYEPGIFKFSNFEKRCLLPALADIKEHVWRFEVLEYKKVEAATRGRPVTHISLTVSKAQKPLSERQKAKVSAEQKRMLRALMVRRGIDCNREIPAMDTLARAATVLSCNVIEVAKRWADAFDRARTFPHLSVGANGSTVGEDLVVLMAERGVGAAFELWLKDPEAPVIISGLAAKPSFPRADDAELLEIFEDSSVALDDYINSVLDAA